MGYLFGNAGSFVSFYPAVIITILAVAIVLGCLTADLFFLKPVGAFGVEAPGDIT